MKYIIKEKTSFLFFLILSSFLGIKLLGSELYFLIKLTGGLISIGLMFLVFHLIAINDKNLRATAKKLFIFIFFALSFFLNTYLVNSQNINSFFEIKTTGGVLLFIIYIAFFIIFKLNLTINSIISLISFSLIPVFAIGDMTYSAETFAVFGFLTSIISCIFLILKLRQDYETI